MRHGHRYPINIGKRLVTDIGREMYCIKLDGITHIITEVATISRDKERVKKIAKDIIDSSDIDDLAIGAIFFQKQEGKVKIYPVVWVKSINTFFYETACGSGTAAIGILMSTIQRRDQTISVIQPSGYEIRAEIIWKDESVQKAKICGKIFTDDIVRTIKIEI